MLAGISPFWYGCCVHNPNDIASNAKRLLDDAELLHANKRHATALVCAVLALEEAIKWQEIVHRGSRNEAIVTGKRGGHDARAREVGEYVWTAELSATASPTLGPRYPIELGVSAADKLDGKIDRVLTALEMLVDKGDAAIAQKLEEHATARREHIRSQMNKVRKQATYVDDGNSPADISSEHAQEWLELARKLLTEMEIV
jgi:hypothetical protein